MNSIQKGLLALMVGSVASAAFVGCDEDDSFDINSPDWLSSKIDSIANSRNNISSGDTTFIVLSSTTVGAMDNSAAFWTAFSDAVAIPSGKKLTFEFDNYGSGANNWNNWNVCVANNKSRDAEAYKEYFVLRSDAFGWGDQMADKGYAFDIKDISTNYADVAAEAGEEQWAFFKEKMQGAHTVMEIQHVAAGYVYVTAKMTATDGTVLIEEYRQACSPAEDIYAFLVCDGSHFENLSAILTPASIVISESNPARLELANCPKFLTLGDTAFHTGVTAHVYFEDGTDAEADTLDLSFIKPDLSTTGNKTVTVIYNKTSRGNYCAPVYTDYTIAITDFQSIKAVVADYTYYFADGVESLTFAASAEVYGVSSDGTETLLDNADVTFSDVASDGSWKIEYQGLTCTGISKAVKMPAPFETEVSYKGLKLGAEDNTTVWWAVFTDDVQVKVSETAIVKFKNYAGTQNWNNFVAILRKADKSEYAVVRADNFGWGAGYKVDDNHLIATPKTTVTDWVAWLAEMNGADVTVKITNKATTVDIEATMVGTAGNTYVQTYTGIAITAPDDVWFSFTVDGCHLAFE